MEASLVEQIWKDMETLKEQARKEAAEPKSLFGDGQSDFQLRTEDNHLTSPTGWNDKEDYDMIHEQEEEQQRDYDALQADDAKWTIGAYVSNCAYAQRYPKTSMSTNIGFVGNKPYWKLSALQKTHMKISRDNKEAYLKDIEKNLRQKMSLYPMVHEGHIESAVSVLHDAWHALHPDRKLIHEKLCSFVIYYAMKRFHNPNVNDVAKCLSITRARAQQGIKQLRVTLANHPKFGWLTEADLGHTNLYRKGLEPEVITMVKEKADSFQVDLRDDKALGGLVAACQATVRRQRKHQSRHQAKSKQRQGRQSTEQAPRQQNSKNGDNNTGTTTGARYRAKKKTEVSKE